MNAVPLADARDGCVYGGKAVQLGAAIRAGLPAPGGFALSADLVEAIGQDDREAHAALDELGDGVNGAFAVRSSAIGEDSAAASFAGQHATMLNVRGAAAIARAVVAVWRSAWVESALAYRRRIGAEGPVRMGVIIQKLVAADVAGVLFTRNPVTDADELVIEASWGLGEAVVQGLVTPDLYRLDTAGAVLERAAGYKDVAVRLHADGGTVEVPVATELVETLCLSDPQLVELHALAGRCAEVFDGPRDIEWAYAGGRLWLLQCRPVTTVF